MGRTDPTTEALWEVRQRWAAVAMATIALLYALALLSALGDALLVGARAVMVLACLGTLWRLLSKPGRGRWSLYGVIMLAMLVSIAIGARSTHGEAPMGLFLVPPVAFFGALLGGPALGVGLSLLPLAALALGLAFGPAIPHLLFHFASLAFATLALQLLAWRVVVVLREGSAELSQSVFTLRRAHDDVQALQRALSEQISASVAAVEQAAGASGGADLGPKVEVLEAQLLLARKELAPEPALPDTSLGDRLERLRRRLLSAGLWLSAMATALNSVVLYWRGLPESSGVNLAVSAVALAFALLHARRPELGRRLLAILAVVAMGGLTRVTWLWFERSPALPPSTAFFPVGALLITAAFGLHGGLAITLAGALVLAAGIHAHPGLPPVLPLVFAVATASTCWALDRLPRDLLRLLERWQRDAREEIRHRRRLVATLVHDLANPLHVVRMLLDDERTGEDDARLRAMARRMRLVVETALGGPDAPRLLDAVVLCAELEQLFRERLSEKGQRLRVQGAEGRRLWACEPLLRESVLGNLLSNAIKFSPRGAEIELSIRDEPAGVLVCVEDRGAGVPADVRRAVAARSEAVSRRGTDGEQGSGFGLMLAHDYVSAMGGTLEVAEREGGGAAVLVRLPAAPG